MELVIIAISGPHGAGKSTIAKALAKEFSLRYVSAGEIFRKKAKEYGLNIIEFSKYVAEHPEIDLEIDNEMRKEALKGNVVLDSQLAYWMVRDYNPISILVIASKEDRIKRIMEREKVPYEVAKKDIEIRDNIEKERFKRLYGVELWNLNDFHFVINTSKLTKEESIKIAISICRVLLNRREK